MTFTVMISTRDRCAEVAITCSKLAGLLPPPDEVLICADGCRDETIEMLRLKFPRFKVFQNQSALGDIGSRDRMLRVAHGDVVLSIDDDSYPLQRDFLRKLERAFEEHPEAAVIVFPELRDGNTFSAADKTDQSRGHYVSAYANCAAAMRRKFYLERSGFPEFFTHMYEEPDYALQCYAAGSAVWFEPALTVRHHVSPINRKPIKRHHSNARNELWSVWLRCPWPWLPIVSAYRLLRQFVCACAESGAWAICEPIWWLAALKGCHRCLRLRRPVPWRIYYHWMRLARNPIHSVRELHQQFGCSVAEN